MLSMTEGDVASTIDFATRLVCQKLGLRDFELITEEAMLQAIGSVNPTTHKVLVRFITAYREWFKFGKTCEEAQKTNSMTPADYHKLGELMNEREASRNASDELRPLAALIRAANPSHAPAEEAGSARWTRSSR